VSAGNEHVTHPGSARCAARGLPPRAGNHKPEHGNGEADRFHILISDLLLDGRAMNLLARDQKTAS
jgi:hypothetical protein